MVASISLVLDAARQERHAECQGYVRATDQTMISIKRVTRQGPCIFLNFLQHLYVPLHAPGYRY
jgi:hypothetical protein